MSQQAHLTTGELADVCGVPQWRIRRLVDSLDIEIPRAGLYRLVPRDLLATTVGELERRGCKPHPADTSPSVSCCEEPGL